MEKVTRRQQAVLDVLDEQIAELDEKLAKVQPVINERNRLLATRRALLAERTTTGGAGNGRPRLSMEEVIHVLREAEEAMTVAEIAAAVGYPEATVRSHLNRHREERYVQDEDGDWELTENA
jgi:DNA-binding transcriptional ArsR family regulator